MRELLQVSEATRPFQLSRYAIECIGAWVGALGFRPQVFLKDIHQAIEYVCFQGTPRLTLMNRLQCFNDLDQSCFLGVQHFFLLVLQFAGNSLDTKIAVIHGLGGCRLIVYQHLCSVGVCISVCDVACDDNEHSRLL